MEKRAARTGVGPTAPTQSALNVLGAERQRLLGALSLLQSCMDSDSVNRSAADRDTPGYAFALATAHTLVGQTAEVLRALIAEIAARPSSPRH